MIAGDFQYPALQAPAPRVSSDLTSATTAIRLVNPSLYVSRVQPASAATATGVDRLAGGAVGGGAAGPRLSPGSSSSADDMPTKGTVGVSVEAPNGIWYGLGVLLVVGGLAAAYKVHKDNQKRRRA